MKNQYIILTGGKNNAGDFLIIKRVRELLLKNRPDRNIINWNAWEPLTDEMLSEVNRSKALILAGGPALQTGMYPKIYPLIDDLDQIKVPIITMGIGWKSMTGDWQDTYKYKLSNKTHLLLRKINKSGYFSGVRDYHTLNTLQSVGYDNFIMTGDPALYDFNCMNEEIQYPTRIKSVGFSMGVALAESRGMELQTKNLILGLMKRFGSENFKVAFHHGLSDSFLKTHNPNKKLYRKQESLIKWLEKEGILYEDISGSVNNLISFYESVDLHIGFRVHAHIYMNSLSKLSVLISEDGRAKALKNVIGGNIFEGYHQRKNSLLLKVLNKLNMNLDPFDVNEHIMEDIQFCLEYGLKNSFHQFMPTRKIIDFNYSQMESFLKQLP